MRGSVVALSLLMILAWPLAAMSGENAPLHVGPSYKIVEPDMLQEILARLKAKQDSGETIRLQEAAAKRARAMLLHPKPVEGITKATSNRVFHYDPTVVAYQDILAPDGRVIVPRGTRANPLDVQDFGDPMLFFDARDPTQVAKAKQLIQQYKGGLMPVLTGGSFVDLMNAWHRRVYYDQDGFITRKLGIHHVPALVSQEGDLLRIEEFVM